MAEDRKGILSAHLTEVVNLPTFDQLRLPIYESPKSFEKIQKYVRGNSINGTTVFPQHMLLIPEVKNLTGALNNGNCFVLLGRSLASTMNIPTGMVQPEAVLFDACVISVNRPTVLLSYVDDANRSEQVQIYNTAVARGVVNAVRTYSTATFAVLHGIICERDVESSSMYCKAVSGIEKRCSKLLNPYTLVMNESKMEEVIRAVIASVAIMQPVVLEDSFARLAQELHILSLDHFCILTECLDRVDSYDVEVGSESELISITLELANCLQRSSHTTLYDPFGRVPDMVIALGIISRLRHEHLEQSSLFSLRLEQTSKRDFFMRSSDVFTEKTYTIRVSDIPNDTSEEILELYFENTSKDTVDVVEIDSHRKEAIVYFSSLEGVDRVMMKKTHLILKKLVTVDRYYRTKPKDIASWIMDISDEKTVEVIGGQGLKKELLRLYFEDEIESGGSHVTDIRQHENRTFITFKTEQEAKQVCQREHTLEDKLFKAEQVKPKAKYEDRFFISGLKATTTSETLEAFLHREIKSDVEITYGKQLGTAIVEVMNPFRLNAVRKLCSLRPLEGEFLNISSVPISNCIRVRSTKTLSKDSLRLYFQSKGSGNEKKARVSKVAMDEDGQSALVYFQNDEVINGIIAKGQHEVLGSKVDVTLHLEEVEMDSKEPLWKKAPLPLMIDSLDRHVVRYIKDNPRCTDNLRNRLGDKISSLTWHPSGTEAVLSIVGKPSCQGDLQLRDTDAEKAFRMFLYDFWSKEITVPLHSLWGDLRKKLHSRPQDDETKIYEFEDDCMLAVAGQRKAAEDLATEVERIVSGLDEEQKMDKNKKEESLSDIDPLKLRFLEKTGYVSRIKSQFPSLHFGITEDAIVLGGNYEDITKVKKDIENKLRTFVVSRISNMTNIHLQMPSDEYLCKYIDEQLKIKRENLTGHWHTEGNILNVIGESDADIKDIVSVITESLNEQVIPVVPEMVELLHSLEWNEFKDEISTTPGVSIFLEMDSSTLRISAKTVDFDVAVEKVKDFISRNTILTKRKTFGKGPFKFLTAFCTDEVKEIESRTCTIIKVVDADFEVTGPEPQLNNALSCLDDLADRTSHRMVHFNIPGSMKLVLSEQGKRYIDALGKRERCTILQHFEDDGNPFPHRDQSLKDVSGEPILVSQVDLPQSKSLMLYRGDITELHVDLLVNPASINLAPAGGLSLQIFEKGGLLLKKDVETLLESDHHFTIGGNVVTCGGDLNCRFVTHAFSPSWAGGKNEEFDRLSEVVTRCLDDACNRQLKSMAIPALSTGTNSFPPREATKIIISTIKDYFDVKKRKSHQGSLTVEKVYVCDNNVQKVRSFLEAIDDVFQPSIVQHTSWGKTASPLCRQPSKGTEKHTAEEYPDSVKLHFYSDKEENIKAAETAMDNYCRETQDERQIDDSLLKTFDEDQRNAVKETELNYDVKVEAQFRLGKIRIRGFAADVKEAYSKIVNILKDVRSLRETIKPNYHWWYYKVEDDKGKTLYKYDDDTSSTLESAYTEKESSIDIMLTDENIHHDFDQMLRSPVSDPQTQSQIIRTESFKGSDIFDPPVTWSPLTSDTVVIITLETDTDEFADLEKNLLDSTDEISDIVKIERIQDPKMWKNFKSKQCLMSEQNSKPEKAITVWSGGSQTNAENLYKLGEKYYDVYRQGVPFAVSVDYLIQNDTTSPDENGYRRILQCRVIKGIPIQDMNNTQYPPQDRKRGVRFDSIVIRDDDDDPVLYKIFNGTQVYPEYLITYT